MNYTRLRIVELDGTEAFATGGDEVIVLPLAGSCRVTIDGERFDLDAHAGWFISAVAELAGGDLTRARALAEQGVVVCDERGDIVAEFGATETGVISAELDLAAATKHRAAFGFFRDRRPELYGRLTQDV